MSQLQEVEIIIDAEGNVKAHVRGVQGTSCIDITKEMFQMLGNQVMDRQLTDEFNRREDELTDRQGVRQ